MIARSLLTLLLLGILATLSFDESFLSSFMPPSVIEYRTAAPLTHGGVDFTSCVLPDLDPWDPENLRFLNMNEDPLRDCRPTVEKLTTVEDGEIILHRALIPKEERNKNYSCAYRCLHPEGDRRITFGEWTSIDEDNRPKCDVFEVNCGSEPNKWSYRFLHHQIYVEEKPEKASTPPSTEENPAEIQPTEPQEDRPKRGIHPKEEAIVNPDVLLIIVDSVSASAMTRALQSTMLLLHEEYDAVAFRHLNKVGMNSRPNGFAFLTGKQIYNIPKNPYSEAIHADISHNEWCKKPLDNSSFIGFAYRDAGYRTLMAEDWAAGVFNWPTCVGFKEKPADHYMRPYQIRVGGHGWGKDYGMKDIVFKRSCREPHNSILDYLEQFVGAYKGEPKFGLAWMTDIAHDGINRLHHADKHFYRFFYDNRERLRNSFIFLMGDHGLRFGKFRASKYGPVEDNNPALVVAVPERLRRGPLMHTLKENALQMVTHYDLFATLSDIASVLPESRFSDFAPLDLEARLGGVFHGSSFLRPLPQPRHCGNLRVPFEYCTCEVKYSRVPDEPFLREAAAHFVVRALNAEIAAANASDKCVPLTVRENATVLERISPGEGLFQIYVVVEPSEAKFSTIFSARSLNNGSFSFEKVSEEFSRLDSYSGQSECTSNARIRPICFCRDAIGKSSKKKGKG